MRLNRLIALALVAQFLAAPAAAGMLVLCFGSDGHVAVELANAGLCCREWRAAHQGTPNYLVETLECASDPCCNDVELFVESATLTVPTRKGIAPHPLPLITPGLSVPCSRVSATAFPLAAESPVAVSIRTVVLRA